MGVLSVILQLRFFQIFSVFFLFLNSFFKTSNGFPEGVVYRNCAKFGVFYSLQTLLDSLEQEKEEDDSCEASQVIDYEIQSSGEDDPPLIPPCSDKTKRRKKRTATGSVRAYEREFYNETTNLLKVIKDINLQRTQAYKDEWELFGLSIASQLRNLRNNYAKSSAKLNIQKAIFEAEQLDMNMSSLPTYTLANLSNHTRISESPPALIPTIAPNIYNSKTTPPSGFKNVTPSSDLGGTTAIPVINKKTTPLIVYPTSATSPGNVPTSSPQAQHFLICTKTKNVVK